MRQRGTGFAVLELLVALVALAVLVSMAIPSLLANRRQAHDMRVRIALTIAAKAEAALEPEAGGFVAAALKSVMPELEFDGDSDSRVYVEVADVDTGDRGQVLLYARSVTGTWFGLRLVLHGDDAGRPTCAGSSRFDIAMENCVGVAW